jgi:DNA phosphorothioation-associated DGQHR protein 1
MATFPLRLPAIMVKQPLGEFFAFSIDAETLRKVAFFDPTRIEKVDKKNFWYSLLGAQRPSSTRRAKQIAKYINTVESAFPNSIILAANYINDGEFQEDENKRWRIEPTNNSCYHLIIPTEDKMVSIIDGQHRLLGFDYCDDTRRSMDLLCAVYMDLPQAYQAYLFATININQRKVDKSLAYEQFGYNLDDENKSEWAPDKLAVFLTRKLNLDSKSPLHNRIHIAPLNAEIIFPDGAKLDWQVSTACIVEGIARLISTNPKADRNTLHKQPPSARRRTILFPDNSPLRQLYLDGNDDAIFEGILAYFRLADEIYWQKASDTYIRKTIGIQALFDVFRVVVGLSGFDQMPSKTKETLNVSSDVDFSDPFYQASGKGRVRVKNTLLLYADLITLGDVSETDRNLFLQLLQKYPKRSTHGSVP